MKHTRGRTVPKATATVYGCSTSISLDEQHPSSWTWTQRPATAGEERALASAPHVMVDATTFQSPSWFRNTRDATETGWFVGAVGLVKDDLQSAIERALETLRADIAAGNVKKGAHKYKPPRDLGRDR